MISFTERNVFSSFSETSRADVSAHFLPPNTGSVWTDLGQFMLNDLKPPNLADKKKGSINSDTISRVAKSLHTMKTKPTTEAPSDPSMPANDHENPKETHSRNEFTRVFWNVIVFCAKTYILDVFVILAILLVLKLIRCFWDQLRVRCGCREKQGTTHADGKVIAADDLVNHRVEIAEEATETRV